MALNVYQVFLKDLQLNRLGLSLVRSLFNLEYQDRRLSIFSVHKN
jgi:hypothetical protein